MKTFNKYIQERYLIDVDTNISVKSIEDFARIYKLEEREPEYNVRVFAIEDSTFTEKLEKYIKNTDDKKVSSLYFNYMNSELSKYIKSKLPKEIKLRVGHDIGYFGKPYVTYYGKTGDYPGSRTVFYLHIQTPSRVLFLIRNKKYEKYIANFANYLFDYIEHEKN